MTDTRFALVRSTGEGFTLWYASLVQAQKSAGYTFRLSWPGRTKDRFGMADEVADLVEVVEKVIRNGARIRWTCEQSGQSNSLGLKSKDVIGYRLDAAVAARCGVPASTA